ncbi:Hsp20/alpha crystallin family protein [Catenisphaera adipataccumulans]|jgi:HSP20 family protein|uniref:HSP20 family molecular chaperone IbpA n=1 Tax=Catenisphaera adipataccumulans TaxID=700500 RepID=A0A7W8CY55_9FIRM|nr:Hsp20/alpha crystallin family protein [Catenisphaera adipataccumulans]MBB5182569.1 HSP20 family molecular chaperone IbpA [Catenisphaera adipataccumulans]
MRYYPGFGFFNDLFNDYVSPSNGMLKTDIREKDGNYELNMEMPGFKKEDVKIELNDGTLTVTATRNSHNDESDDKGRVIRKERYEGTFSRSFYIGDRYKQSDIKASFDNGELKITLPTEAQKIEQTKQYISIE